MPWKSANEKGAVLTRMKKYASVSAEIRKAAVRLTWPEQRALIPAAQAGDAAARDLLSRSVLSLVIQVARKYRNRTGTACDMDDLVQAGLKGFLVGLDRYDSSRSERLSTYTVWYILRHMQDMAAYGHKLWAVNDRTIRRWRVAGRRWQDDVNRFLLSRNQDSRQSNGDDASEEEVREEVGACLNCPDLKAVHREILRAYFGLKDGEAETYKHIGARLGYSKEWVRQLLREAVEIVRDWDGRGRPARAIRSSHQQTKNPLTSYILVPREQWPACYKLTRREEQVLKVAKEQDGQLSIDLAAALFFSDVRVRSARRYQACDILNRLAGMGFLRRLGSEAGLARIERDDDHE